MENNRCYGCMREKQQHPVCEFCGFDERTQNDAHQLPTGTILRGQYLIGRVLGQGGFGITYLGWDMYLDMPVAIKEYYPSSFVTRDTHYNTHVSSYTGDAGRAYEANKERFMREGKTLAKFGDLRNIVQIYSFFPENNTVYLVMEYAKGITLQQYLRENGPMPLEAILKILMPIMEDLQKVHEAGIIHRDISPDNIMLLDGGGAKLLDFGAVRQVEDMDQDTPLSKSTQTILKQGFAPAEQYNARGSLGAWTDVYAMCATICYCLNGKLPMAAPDRAIDDEPEQFIDVLPVTDSQKEILRRGMALRPKERTASMSELLHAFREPDSKPVKKPKTEKPKIEKTKTEKTKKEKREPPKEELPEKTEPAKRPRRKGVLAAVLTVIVLTAGIAVIYLTRGGEESLHAVTTEPATTHAPTEAAPTETAPPETTVPSVRNVLKNPDADRTDCSPSDPAFIQDYARRAIRSITFYDTTAQAPNTAVNAAEEGTVLVWTTPIGGMYKLHIAAEGGVMAPKDCKNLFSDYTGLQEIQFNNAFDISQVTDMWDMFYECESLTRLNFGDSFDTSRVTFMYRMFAGCSSLTDLDLGEKFDTSRVTDMSWMFSDCSRLTNLNLGDKFDTSQVTDMHGMFDGCSSLTKLDLGKKFDTSQVTDMRLMFSDCSRLISLIPGDKFDTSRVIDMKGMFAGCSSLNKLDLGEKFDTFRATDMQQMFDGCSSLTSLDLGDKFDTSRVNYMGEMFDGCSSLTSLDLGDKFDTSRVITDSNGMFKSGSEWYGWYGYMLSYCESLKRLRINHHVLEGYHTDDEWQKLVLEYS